MNLAEQAVLRLFPEERRAITLRYSGRFSSYNANVTVTPSTISFRLSAAWREVSNDIQAGVVQHLACKALRREHRSTEQDLYHSFMRHLTKYARVEEKDPYLLERFGVVNERYFKGLMTTPNLRWGQRAVRKLGHYEYATDTIVISSIFAEASRKRDVEELLDFVLYHEMLHKKHQYDHRKRRAHHHTTSFRQDERQWHDPDAERKLSRFVAEKRWRGWFW